MARLGRFARPACENSSRSRLEKIKRGIAAGTGKTSANRDAWADAGSHRRRAVLVGTAGAAGLGGLAVSRGSRRLTDGGAHTATDDSSPSPTDDPTLVAHRGFAGENPESKIQAKARSEIRPDDTVFDRVRPSSTTPVRSGVR
jgi:glycerophosphoryl diester phosphodiesterase